MSRRLLVLEEVLAMMGVVGIPARLVEQFRRQADAVLDRKPRTEVDNITVASAFGQASRRGGVELTIDDTLTQMDPKQAREVALLLLQAAEAATSDEAFLVLLDSIGITDQERQGLILLDLRAIRQGTRETSNPH